VLQLSKFQTALLTFAILSLGCVTTRSPELVYRGELSIKVNAYLVSSPMAVDNSSVFMKGPSLVNRLYWDGVSRPINLVGLGVPKGSKIVIKKLVDKGDVGSRGELIQYAMILIVDSNTIAYAEWPALRMIIE